MGVHGLWQLLSSTGKPVPLESLEGKVLAVDVSVWLHQLSKGMRDSSGNPVQNAHLHGLFTRICKLLYYRIKPIFVFDGGVPELKKRTLASRRNKREEAEHTSSLMQQKILTNLIRGQVLKEAYGLDKLPDVPPPVKSSTRKGEAIFELPPLPETSKQLLKMKSSEDKTYAKRRELRKLVEENYDDITQIDVESEEFKALPLEIQHEIINDLRLSRKNYNLSRIVDLPEDSHDFSNFQMKKLLKYSKMNSRLDNLRKELNEKQTKKLSMYYGKNFKDYDEVISQRVMSEDSAHYLLAKRKLTQKRDDDRSKFSLKSQMETAEESIVAADDDILDSDKEVDILEESKQIFNEISEKNDDSAESVASTSDGRGSEFSDKRFETSRNRGNEEKPRFKAVIEIESGSESDSIETIDESLDIKQFGYNSAATDFDEDQQIQMAIELSLRDEKKSTEGSNENLDSKSEAFLKTSKLIGKKSCAKLGNSENLMNSPHSGDFESGIPVVLGKGESIKDTHKNISNKNEEREKAEILHKTAEKVSKFSTRTSKLTTKWAGDEMKSNSEIAGSSKVNSKTNGYNDNGYSKRVEPVAVKSNKFSDRLSNVRRKLSKRKIDSAATEKGATSGNVKVINLSDDEHISDDHLHDDSSSCEDDFIEVKVDTTKVIEDELFPASMFEPIVDTGDEPLPKRPKLEPKTDLKDSLVERTDKTVIDIDLVRANLVENLKKNQEIEKQDKMVVSVTKATISEDDKSFDSQKTDDEHEVKQIDVTMDSQAVDRVDLETESEDESVTCSDVGAERMSDDDEDNVDDVDVDDDKDDDINDDDDVERVNTDTVQRPPSPRVTNLALQFESVNEQKVKDMSTTLRQENRQLRLEQGRQERLAMSITDQMHSEAQELLQLFGIPYIVSPTEAEAQCAQLELTRQSHGTITDDSDIWLFGGKCVFKNFFNLQKHVECFKEEHIAAKLGLTRETLINIALLCGSDYTEGIRGVGPVSAMEILAQFPGQGLDGLRKFKTWWDNAQNTIEVKVKQSKLLTKLKELDVHPDFPNPVVVNAYLSPTVDDSCEKCTWSMPDVDMLRLYASQKLNWTRVKTDEVLLPVMKRLADKQAQRGIMSYFQPEVHIQPAAVKSKRLQKVVNKFVNPDAESDNEIEPDDSKKGKRGQKRKNGGNKDAEGIHETESNGLKKARRGQRMKNHTNENKNEQNEEKQPKKGKKLGQKRKNDSDVNCENQGNETEIKKSNKSKKKKMVGANTENDAAVKVDDGTEKRGNKVKLNEIDIEVATDGVEVETDIKVAKGGLNLAGKRTTTRSKKKVADKEGSDSDKSDNIVSTRKGKKVTEKSKSNKGSVASNKNAISDSMVKDTENVSTEDSESDSDSISSNSDDDDEEDVKIVKSGLNIEEILGLKMGYENDEVETVGSSLDVGEILNLPMGCKLDEITSGNESQNEGRVYQRQVNVNEILHLDPGTDSIETEVSGTDPIVVEEDDNKELEPSKDKDAESQEAVKDLETEEGVHEDFASEGGFIKDDDDDEEMKTEDFVNEGGFLKEGSDVEECDFEFDNLNKNIDFQDIAIVEETGKNRNSKKLKVKKTENMAGKQSGIFNDSEGHRKTRSTRSNSALSEEKLTSSRSKQSSLKIKNESVNTASKADSESGASRLLTEIKTEPISQEDNNTKTMNKSAKTKKSVIKANTFSDVPLNPVVTGLPWADKKKGKKKGHGGKTLGLNLVPKEMISKREKKVVPRSAIGCVNLSESDSDN